MIEKILWRLGGLLVLVLVTLTLPAFIIIDAAVKAGCSMFDNLKGYCDFARSVFK